VLLSNNSSNATTGTPPMAHRLATNSPTRMWRT
jgi:hypothetical protein